MNRQGLGGREKLEEAFKLHDRLYLEKYPPLEDLMEYKLSRKNRGYGSRLGKRGMAILVAAVLLAASVLSVSAVRDSILDFAIHIYERFAEFVCEDEDVVNAPTRIEKVYPLKRIPSGYEAVDEYVSENEIKCVWGNEDGGIISWTQLPLDAKSTLDKEESVWQTLQVADMEIYMAEKYDKRCFIWNRNGYLFTLTVSNEIAQDMCVEMIVSVFETET